MESLDLNYDGYDLLSTSQVNDSIEFEENRLKHANHDESAGVSLRAQKSGRIGVAHERVSLRVLDRSFSEVLDRVKTDLEMVMPYGLKTRFDYPQPVDGPVEERKVDALIEEISHETWIREGEETIKSLRDTYPGVSFGLSYEFSRTKTSLATSSGFRGSREKGVAHVSLSALRVDENGLFSPYFSISALSPRGLMGFLQTEVRRHLDFAKKKGKSDSGKKIVLFTPRGFKLLLGMVLGALSGRKVEIGSSFFKGRQGDKLFTKHFSLTDRPDIERPPMAGFDHEGVTLQPGDLIRDGKILTFFTDGRSEEKTGIKGLRRFFRGLGSLGEPGSTYIDVGGGRRSSSDLLSEIKDGYLVDSFIGGGMSNVLNGDFSVNVEVGYRVVNGEIEGRIKDTMMFGNTFELLQEAEFSSDRLDGGYSNIPWVVFPGVSFTTKAGD